MAGSTFTVQQTQEVIDIKTLLGALPEAPHLWLGILGWILQLGLTVRSPSPIVLRANEATAVGSVRAPATTDGLFSLRPSWDCTSMEGVQTLST